MEARTHSRRTRPSKGDLREAAILGSVERLLASRRPKELTVEEVAQAAGMSRPNFYFYFASIEDVILALYERAVRAVYAAPGAAPGDLEDPRALLEANMQLLAHTWREHGPVLRAAMHYPRVATFAESQFARGIEAVAAGIAAERARGAAPKGAVAPLALSKALNNMSRSCLYQASLERDPAHALQELVPTLTDIWMRGVYGKLSEDDKAGTVADDAAAQPERTRT